MLGIKILGVFLESKFNIVFKLEQNNHFETGANIFFLKEIYVKSSLFIWTKSITARP